MVIETSEEVSLEFAIIQLRYRTDPAVETWASANEFDVIESLHFTNDKLPTGYYELLSTKALLSCFNLKSRTAGLCGVS